jgi:hypothetical protein
MGVSSLDSFSLRQKDDQRRGLSVLARWTPDGKIKVGWLGPEHVRPRVSPYLVTVSRVRIPYHFGLKRGNLM